MRETDFAKYLSAFLRTYMPAVRNVSTQTIKSYRDSYRLLLLFCREEKHISAEKVTLEMLSEELIQQYLDWIEKGRGCSISTRNQRLAALHAFFRYVQFEEPVFLSSCQRILAIPFKKHMKPSIQHLTPDALKLILDQPDKTTQKGRRDLTLLSVLYDTGARVQELADLQVRDVRLHEPSVISLTGKGRKKRHIPIMRNTSILLETYMKENKLDNRTECLERPLFTNRQCSKFTRAGIAYILKKYAKLARNQSSIIPDSLSPHMLRHTKAMHLYQSGVALVYIRDFLGHVDIETTDIYARADTEMKRKELEKTYPEMNSTYMPDWKSDEGLLSWLNSF